MIHIISLPDGDRIEYLLKRSSRRRSIGLKISKDGLVVTIPSRLGMRELNSVLSQKLEWIQEKLHYHRHHAQLPMQWHDGMELLLLDRPIRLHIQSDTRQRANVTFDGVQLTVALNNTDDIPRIREKVLLWYKQQALADFSRRTALLAQKLGVPVPPISLSSARSRWGSCNNKGQIRLNWRLIQASPMIIQYVIAHELAHLKEMNHSRKFWAVVESVFPAYREAEAELKQLSSRLHAID